jgi:hypothetical protein
MQLRYASFGECIAARDEGRAVVFQYSTPIEYDMTNDERVQGYSRASSKNGINQLAQEPQET